jgi:hypothetical protein
MIREAAEGWRDIPGHEVLAIERSKVDTHKWTGFHFYTGVIPLPNFLFIHIRGGR